jgi:hypothetical protein
MTAIRVPDHYEPPKFSLDGDVVTGKQRLRVFRVDREYGVCVSFRSFSHAMHGGRGRVHAFRADG